MRARRRAAGQCVDCGAPSKDHRRCKACRFNEAERQLARRVEADYAILRVHALEAENASLRAALNNLSV